jgi:hypothetical protein
MSDLPPRPTWLIVTTVVAGFVLAVAAYVALLWLV